MADDRRAFLGKFGVGLASQVSLAAAKGEDQVSAAVERPTHRFRLAIWLDELGDRLELTLERELEIAKEIGVEHVWFHQVPGETLIARMSDAEVDRLGERVARQGLKLFMISAWTPFHNLQLVDFDVRTMQEHSGFRKDFDSPQVDP